MTASASARSEACGEGQASASASASASGRSEADQADHSPGLEPALGCELSGERTKG